MDIQTLKRIEETIILLDTNIVMVPSEFGLDIYEEIPKLCDFLYRLAYVDRTIGELEGLQLDKKQRIRKQAQLSQDILRAKKLTEIDTSEMEYHEEVDDLLITIAEELNAIRKNHCIIATNDYELKMRAKAKKIPLITLRKKQYFIFENYSKI
jgi:rRNA-processing protein FCF1